VAKTVVKISARRRQPVSTVHTFARRAARGTRSLATCQKIARARNKAHKIAEAANTTPGKVSGRTTGQYQRNSPRNTLHGSGESPGQRLR